MAFGKGTTMMKIRGRISAFLRRKWRKYFELSSSFKYDQRRFKLYADPQRQFSRVGHREAYILMLAHSVEKGLSLPSRRQWFGGQKIGQLISSCNVYSRSGRAKTWVVDYVHEVLAAYLANQAAEDTKGQSIRLKIRSFLCDRRQGGKKITESMRAGGTKLIKREDLAALRCENVRNFLTSRSSVRQFTETEIDDATIVRAVQLAQTAPSVCNRQAGRVHIFDRNGPWTEAILACQNGNIGFGHLASKILIVTCDLECFLSVSERNQAWIDGGLFGMSLIYGLHAEGVGTCCLNWSATVKEDKRLRSVTHIPANESIIMLIAAGHVPEQFEVAFSRRRPLDDVLTVHRELPK